MTNTQTTPAPTWQNRWTFILAATGSAVGLGNIWKFPYITGEYGGGAFVLVYLACILLIGVPVMIAEVLLGRLGKSDPIHSMTRLSIDARVSKSWSIVGISGVLAGLMILSFYSVVAGWAIEYVIATFRGDFANADKDGIAAQFSALLVNKQDLITYHSIFIAVTATIIAFGASRGIGIAVRVLMPVLFILLLVLLGYGIQEGDFRSALHFMFSPDFSKLSGDAVLVALGHAFFTLSLGMGAIMTYGAYMPQTSSVAKTVVTVAVLDTVIALIAGLAIFPLVFANGLEPSSGPGLMFVSLPIAFGSISNGAIFGGLFFVLVSIAALSSSISLIEPGVAWLERLNVKRWIGTLCLTLIAWGGGMACIYSNDWLETQNAWGAFEWLEHIASNIMLPLGGLFIAIFVGWKLRRGLVRKNIGIQKELFFNIWYGVLRIIAPLGIIVVFLKAVNIV